MFAYWCNLEVFFIMNSIVWSLYIFLEVNNVEMQGKKVEPTDDQARENCTV